MKSFLPIMIAAFALVLASCGNEEDSAVRVLRVSAPGMHCSGCTSTVEETLGKMAGVDSVTADLDSRDVTVYCDTTLVSRGELEEMIARLGFDSAPEEE